MVDQTSDKGLVPSHVPRDHPMVTRDYSLFTLSIDAMVNDIAQWLDDQVEGATIYGPSRFGKSSAVDNWLQQLLSERYGGFVPMVIWSHIDSGGQASVGRFYAHLLDASKHELAQAAKSPMDRERMLIERWIRLAHYFSTSHLHLVLGNRRMVGWRLKKLWSKFPEN